MFRIVSLPRGADCARDGRFGDVHSAVSQGFDGELSGVAIGGQPAIDGADVTIKGLRDFHLQLAGAMEGEHRHDFSVRQRVSMAFVRFRGCALGQVRSVLGGGTGQGVSLWERSVRG